MHDIVAKAMRNGGQLSGRLDDGIHDNKLGDTEDNCAKVSGQFLIGDEYSALCGNR